MLNGGQLKPDPEKIWADLECPVPTCHKQLQCFLWFAHFYRFFIKNYSSIAAPLTKLTSTTSFAWTPTFQFLTILNLFSSAPVLIHSNTELQFVVEVDASDSGVGANLFQCSSVVQTLHPCAFFSHCLTPAERNYDEGNQELLAVVLALQESGHLLEGAVHL